MYTCIELSLKIVKNHIYLIHIRTFFFLSFLTICERKRRKMTVGDGKRQ